MKRLCYDMGLYEEFVPQRPRLSTQDSAVTSSDGDGAPREQTPTLSRMLNTLEAYNKSRGLKMVSPDVEAVVKLANNITSKGKKLFKREDYLGTIRKMSQARDCLLLAEPEDPRDVNRLQDLKMEIYIRLAICYFRFDNFAELVNLSRTINQEIDANNLSRYKLL